MTDNNENLNNIALDINKALSERMGNSLLLGKLLADANEQVKGAEFVAWVEEATGLKKAQAYKWMKVYKVFGEDKRFEGVSTRVLYILSSQSEDLIAKAARFKGRGKALDTNAVNELIKKEQRVIEKANKKEPEPEALPESEKEATGSQEAPLAVITPDNLETAPVVLTDDLKIALDTIKTLEEKIAELTKPKAKPAIPALPQFSSPYPAIVLGLDTVNKETVNKSYRFFAKLYPKSSNPEVAERLKSARDSLLSKKD